MTEETDNGEQPVNADTDDLNKFESLYFGKKEEAVEEPVEEVEDQPEEDDNPLATEEDEEEPEAEEEEEDDSEEEEEPEPKPKNNRKSAKERINELTARAREGERREQDLLRRLEALEGKKEDKAKPEDIRNKLPIDAPNPDVVGEDGEPVYPLGEFDPLYIRDLTKFTIEQETKIAKEEAKREAQESAMQQAQQEVADSWTERLDKFEEEAPEIREDILHLTDTFQDLDPAYGEYLATTIMMSEAGPKIMQYLSQNIGEAQKIVASGPAAATLALGRLEAILSTPTKPEKKRNIAKVSEAPTPPEDRTRGHGGKFSVSGDTDDLDAFEREYFKKK